MNIEKSPSSQLRKSGPGEKPFLHIKGKLPEKNQEEVHRREEQNKKTKKTSSIISSDSLSLVQGTSAVTYRYRIATHLSQLPH